MALAKLVSRSRLLLLFSGLFTIVLLAYRLGPPICYCENVKSFEWWIDNLSILYLFVPITLLMTLITIGDGTPRLVHLIVTFILLIWAIVTMGLHYIPSAAKANLSPANGGYADNPANDPYWCCFYNGTGSGCPGFVCDNMAELCTVTIDPVAFTWRQEFTWGFSFTIVFIALAIIDIGLIFLLRSTVLAVRKQMSEAEAPAEDVALLQAGNFASVYPSNDYWPQYTGESGNNESNPKITSEAASVPRETFHLTPPKKPKKTIFASVKNMVGGSYADKRD